MMKESRYISLKQMIENLGYSNAAKLSNWMQAILNDTKEFKCFLKTPRQYDSKTRTPETDINIEAEVLVGNLCEIYAFPRLFPSAQGYKEKRLYKPYEDLKDGKHHKYIDSRVAGRLKRYHAERERNETAIRKLNVFVSALKSRKKINLLTDSLRILRHKVESSSSASDFNPYELSCWDDLLKLRDKLESSPQDSTVYRQISETYYNLKMIDDSLEAVERCIEMCPKDGIAWAIKSKLLLKMLKPSKKEHFLALAMTDFSGHISAPITSEERWINERVDETAESSGELREELVRAALNALDNWPHWESVPRSDGRKNYHPHTAINCDCGIEVGRGWLFFHLVMNLSPRDLFEVEGAKRGLLDAYKNLCSSGSYAFPGLMLGLFSEEEKLERTFQMKLTSYMALISEDAHKELLETFIEEFKGHTFDAAKNLEALSSSPISNAFWGYLGPVDYKNLYSLLATYKKQNDEHEKLSTFSKLVYAEIKSGFSKAEKLFYRYANDVMFRRIQSESESEVVTETDVETEFESALVEVNHAVQALDNLVDREAIFKLSDPKELHGGYGELMLYLSLIEYNLTGSSKALKVIDLFAQDNRYMERCVGSDDDNLLSLFNEFWGHDGRCEQASKPEQFFHKAMKIVDERHWEEMSFD